MDIKTGTPQQQLDHLQEQLKLAEAQKQPEQIILTKLSLSELLLSQNNLKQALAHVQQAQTILENGAGTPDHLLAAVYAQFSQTYVKSYDFSQTAKYSTLLLPISRSLADTEKEIIALKNLGIVAAAKANYKEAMEYFIEGLEKSKASGFRQMTAQSLINIATIYANLFNYNDALQRYDDVLNDYADVITADTHAIILNNVGNLYISKGAIEKAYDHFDKSYHLAKARGNKKLQAHTLAQLSRALVAQNDLENALEKANAAQRMIDEIGDTSAKPINWLNLAGIHFRQGQFSEANLYASRAAALAKSSEDNTNEIRAYKLLSKIFEAQEDFRQALKYQKIYGEMQERYSEVQRNRQALDLEINYSIKEKQKAIENLRKENEYQSLLLKNKDQIARQNEQLTEANEELKQFAYVASHDLKEPLRMIGSYTQLIHKLFEKEADEETQSYFSYVGGGVKRMNNLLDALLQYATIGRSEEEITQVNLVDIVDICKLHLRVRIEETNSTVEQFKLPVVKANRTRMLQLFQNLISNAIKFQRSDVAPRVQINAEERKDDFLISVKDNGIGIPEEFKDRIFEIFQRLHTSKTYEGTGIGLAVCHKIIKRLGGSIWVESVQGEGTCFFFTIPKNTSLG